MQVLQMQTVITKKHSTDALSWSWKMLTSYSSPPTGQHTSAMNLHFTSIMSFNTVLLNQATPNMNTKHH